MTRHEFSGVGSGARDDRQCFAGGLPGLDLFFQRFAGQNRSRRHLGVACIAVAEHDNILGFVLGKVRRTGDRCQADGQSPFLSIDWVGAALRVLYQMNSRQLLACERSGERPAAQPGIPLRVARYCLTYSAFTGLRLVGASKLRVRAAFGPALKKSCCAFDVRTQCNRCDLKPGCTFPVFFEDDVLDPDAGNSGFSSPPRPFVLELPGPPRRGSPLKELRFNLVLIGRANDLLADLLPVFRDAGQRGLIVLPDGRLWRSELTEISRLDLVPWFQRTPISDGWTLAPNAPQEAGYLVPPAPDRVRLHFVTPVDLRHHGRRLGVADFRFEILFLRLLKRVALLHRLYGTADPQSPDGWAPPLDAVAGVETLAADLRPASYLHQSERTGTVQYRGLKGTLDLGGDLAPVWPLLFLGLWTHVGKQTAEGMGQYRLEPL